MKRLIFFSLFLFVSAVIYAQADTVVFPQPDVFPEKGEDQTVLEYIGVIVTYLFSNWRDILGLLSAFVMAFEVLVSAIPTSKDWSLLTRIRQWLDNARGISFLTKNRKSGGGQFKVKSEPENND